MKIIALILILSLLVGCGASPSVTTDVVPPSPQVEEAGSGENPLAPQISAASAILIEVSTGKVLYEKNAREKSWPASITKIMTALLGIESGDVKRVVPVAEDAVGTEGSSIYLKDGEKIAMEDLLYGMMLRSGNDAAMAVAAAAAPSIDEFVVQMNQRAQEIGALDTHFMNPSGLHDEAHYTTAYDMALIAREAMKNPVFREIAAAKEWNADREGEDPYNHFENKNKVVYQYEGGTGIKLGYTQIAGRTLVASSCRDGMEVICVVLNDPNWFEDAYALMDFAYANWEMVKVMDGGGPLLAIPVERGEKDHVQAGLSGPVFLPVRKEETLELELRYDIPEKVAAPTSRWQEAGSLEFWTEGSCVWEAPLFLLEDLAPYVPEK
ncbi:MAG: D-alanyl-D-alanine carboxypeptidase [Firmicutes bacterium]|nr:D-alanyl-D-alanine carboxypeptidase [Bacillota bacterium]